MAEPGIDQRSERPYVAIRRRVTMDGFAEAVDSAFPALFDWLAERGMQPAGAPFIRYLKVDMDRELDIDLAVPVGAPLAGDERVHAGALPAGRWVVQVHVGPYGGLRDAHEALQNWAREQGIATDGRVETYLTNPREEPDSSRWETELAYLIA